MRSKRFLSFLLAFTIAIVNLIPVNFAQGASKKTKNYLILVEQTAGHWVAYDNLVRLTPDGNLMVPAELLAMALGYLYQENTTSVETVTISKTTSVKNTYTIGKKDYTYQNGKSKIVKKTASVAATKYNDLFYCHLSTLMTLSHVSYFSGDSIAKYKEYGDVDGVYCFSNVKKASSVPNYNKVYTPYSQLWYKTFVNLNKKELDQTTLYGVTFYTRDHFLQSYEIGRDMNDNPSVLNKAMDEKAMEYTKAYRDANKITTDAWWDRLDVSTDGKFSYTKHTFPMLKADPIKINNTEYWKIEVFVNLTDKEQDLNTLKALCYFISSTPETLYNVITYDLFTRPVVPGIPGIKHNSQYYWTDLKRQNWIGVIGRQFGDFVISVAEVFDTSSGVTYDPTRYSSIVYYVKQASE